MEKAFVKKLNFSGKNKKKFKDVEFITLDVENGVAEDIHEANEKLQVALFEGESDDFRDIAYEKYGVHGFCTEKFVENINTWGIEYEKLQTGDLMEIGGACIEITKLGKNCHEKCPLRKHAIACPMATKCAFAKVVSGGGVKKGSSIKMLKKQI